MTDRAQTSWLQLHEVLSERAAKLGMPCWACDETGTIIRRPSNAPNIQFFSSTDVQSLVQRTAHRLFASKTPQDRIDPCAIFSGAYLLPIEHIDSGRTLGGTLALVMQKSALFSDDFAALAQNLQMPIAGARDAMMPIVRRTQHEISQLHEVLRWSCEDLCAKDLHQRTLNQFGEKLVQAYEETNMLFRLVRSLNCIHDPMQLMTLVCHQLQQTLPLAWVAVRFIDNGESNKVVPPLAGQMIVAGRVPCESTDFEHHAATILTQWSETDWTRLLEPAKHPFAKLVGAEVIAEQITHDQKIIGVLLAGNRTGDEQDLCSAEIQFIDAAADFLGVFHENLMRFDEQHTLFMGTLKALTAAIDAKDAYTRGHSERVALLARQMAIALELDAQTIEQYYIAGLVHDVGKIGIPEAVLCKPARLTDAEFEIIKRHTSVGCEILKDIPMLASMLPGVLHHHERWDGTGYPHRLHGEHIPLVARVLALADAFDAMSSNRAYRPALSRNQVFAEIQRCAGKQFDPALAEVFITLDFGPFDATLLLFQQNRRAA